MGQLQRRQDDEQASISGTNGSKVWLETCGACGRPVTILAPTRPSAPLCNACDSPDIADPAD